MKEELIKSVSKILNEWNPLGEKAGTIRDLECYKYEAMDILSTIQITKLSVTKAVSVVITNAFGITLNEAQLEHYSSQIEQVLDVKKNVNNVEN